VAGSFYPDRPAELAAVVDRLLAGAQPPRAPPRALVVPHAGYVFSGPVAATAYAWLRDDTRRRVVALGPSHWTRLRGVAASGAETWSTPLGDLPVDPPPAGAATDRAAHEREHALEVQLPFLQRLWGDFSWLPLAVGTGPAERAADLLEPLWADPSVVVICSTDLSHYHDRLTAERRDRRTAAAVTALDVDALRPEDACGVHALRAVLVLAERHRCKVRLLDLRTSADTAGGDDRVVGYAAFTVTERRGAVGAGRGVARVEHGSEGVNVSRRSLPAPTWWHPAQPPVT
jgi:MEMO1 family protein